MHYRLIEKQIMFKGKKVQVEVHRLENEETGKELRREICIHPGAVVILPFLGDKVLLIRNHRYSVQQVLIELPAGTVEKGEDPMNCAGRELLEETGYLAGRLKPLGTFFSSPGILTEKLYTFAAYDLEKKVSALEEDEEIEIMPLPFDEAVEMIRSGQIMDAKTIATLLMFERFHRAST
ncbi:MAG TPA: NUDIX hydrolase [Tepidisphaeraceae bacterium]|jgi:ADP-ribose pyrophosphatase|nr:NUDIX hydrolase [Tepidisphaeraceae bacterium]